jgi:hypothetical protein
VNDDNEKSASWFGRLIKVKGFKKSVITGGITGILCGCLKTVALFLFEIMRIQVMSVFPFGGLLADGFNVRFWWILAVTAVGCVLIGIIGGGVAVAVAVRGGKELKSPKKVGMAGGAVGGILVFFVALLGMSGWSFGMFGMMLSMLPAMPFVLADVVGALLGH